MKLLRILISVIILAPICAFAQYRDADFTMHIFPARRQIVLYRGSAPIMEVDSIQFDFITPAGMKMTKSTPGRMVVQLAYPNVPIGWEVNKYENFTVDLHIDSINGGWHIYAHPRWAHDISIYLKYLHGHYFGIRENLVPDNHKSPDITGSIQRFDVKGENSRYHENFASGWSAFFFNSLGYASFFDTFAKGQYQLGINGRTVIYHRTGSLDWYIFTGRDGDQIMKEYYDVIGAPKYVPSWACGVSIWRDQDWNGKKDVLNDAKQMTALKIPITSIMIDRPYSNGIDGWSKMDFGKLFSDPGRWIHELNADYNLRLLTWVSTCTFGDTNIVKAMPGGDHGYIDLTNPVSVSRFDNALTRNIYDYGVQGNKMDRGDEVFPAEDAWYDHTPPAERRNKYIYLYAKVIDSVLTAKWGKDNFNYSRSGMQGSQKYLSALWGGDSRESWDGLACSVANAIRVGFIGFPDWGSDVGGYRGNAGYEPEDLYTRWLQFGTWSGMDEIKLDGSGGQGKDRAPWHYGDRMQENFRRACEERMELAPYVYSQLNTSADNGVLMKPLAYEYPGDPRTYEIWDEYCFGQSFLVSPVVRPGEKTQSVYLPAGVWYDLYSPKKAYVGGRAYKYELSMDHIPVFVRQNAVFVTGRNWLNGNSVNWKGKTEPALVVNVFPGKKNFENRFGYVDRYNNDTRRRISVSQKGNVLTIHVPPLGCAGRIVVYNLVPQGKTTVNGKAVLVVINRHDMTVTVPFTKMSEYTVRMER